MDIEKIISKYVEEEKQIMPNPFLENHIKAKIKAERVSPKIRFWHVAIVAASILIVVMVGIGLGKSYDTTNDDYIGLEINDIRIENFFSLTENENE